MNISKLFISAAEKYPEKNAIIHGDSAITYGNLLEEVKTTAGYFKAKGISAGDRVLVFIPMGIPLYRTVLALFYIGASAVFLDEWVNTKRLALCCRLAECKGFIGIRKARLISFFIKDLRNIPVKLNPSRRGESIPAPVAVHPEDTALITFTTGSTGTPKAADRSHAFLKEQFEALLDEINPTENDIDLTTLPIVLFVNLGVGCTSVIADFKISKPEKLDTERLWKLLQRTKVNRLISSPSLMRKLSSYLKHSKKRLDSVNQIFTGGAPVFPSDAKAFIGTFPKAKIKLVYGSTECEPISAVSASELMSNNNGKLGQGLLVGDIYHKTELRIIKISEGAITTEHQGDLNRLTLGEDQIGEIIVSGPHVLKRYFKNERAFKENKIICEDQIWHRTGDSGFLLGGKLYLTGRCVQLIEDCGDLISPFLVENMMSEIEGVEIGTLLKVDNKLILAVESQLSETQINKALDENVKFDQLVKVKSIARDPRHNSKIDYQELEDEIKSMI